MADEGNNIEITIKTPKDKVKLTISPSITIKDLKVLISDKFSASVGQLVIIFSGKILKDDATVESYHIKNDNTVHLVIKSSTSSSSTKGSTSNESKPETTTPQSQSNTQNPSAGNLPFNLGSMGGMGGLGSGMNLQEMQQQMMNNPEMLSQMMQNPMVQSMINNPDILQSMITNNPQMQELMQRNPEITHILNNPRLMQQTLEMAQNPAMLQEMMRNQDRAMSNLESIPGGYNALRRMYTDIQEPMLNAAQDQFGQNPFAALAGGNQTNSETQNTENVTPLPNPWQSGTTQSTRSNTASSNKTSTATGTTDSKPTTTPSSSNMFSNPAMQNLMQQINSNPLMMQGMMNSPYMQNMMQSLSSNPQLAQQMLSQNPMFANNPQMQEMLPTMLEQMQRPEMQQLMTNPQAMEAMMQIQSGMATLQQQAPGIFPGAGGINPAGTTNPSNPTSNPANLAQMMQNLATGATTQQPPEIRFRAQLDQLQQMGFFNQEENIQALVRTGGNVSQAIEDLLK